MGSASAISERVDGTVIVAQAARERGLLERLL